LKKRNLSGILYFLLLVVLVVTFFSIFGRGQEPAKVTYSQLINLFQEEQVTKFEVVGYKISCELKDQSIVTHEIFSLELFKENIMPLVLEQQEKGIITDYDFKEGFTIPWWVSFLPYLLLIALFIAVWYFTSRQMNGKAPSFAKARVKMGQDEKEKKTFDDVAGADEEKEELTELVEFLKAPRRFLEIGARIPKGVLLIGPPGTGKTLLAKAVAGEAGVPFYSISGSDFVELYVGVGASRVRDLFEQAKKNSPCIIFIDEIDAVGRRRGAGIGGGHDEREQTLNQLLVEMDGFGRNAGIIVIAATNRADILDPALLRPGRFDREVYVGKPDQHGREEILKVHARGKKFEDGVSFKNIAKSTVGFTGADLENLLNEAALLAARQNRQKISEQNIQDAVMKVIAGPEKKSRKVVEKERKLTAYHETGHAVVAKFLETADPVHEISIIPRGFAGGYTMHLPAEDLSYSTKNVMFEEIVSLLGGRVCEMLTLDDISTGASNDIERATSIAKSMVTKFGMSEKIGPILYGSDTNEVFLGHDLTTQRDYSEHTASLIDSEIKSIIDRAYERAKEILTEHMAEVVKVAELLLEKEKITGQEFNAIFESEQQDEASDLNLENPNNEENSADKDQHSDESESVNSDSASDDKTKAD